MTDETKPREPCETCGSKWRMLDQCADCLLRTSREKRIARAISDARAAGIAEGRRQVMEIVRAVCLQADNDSATPEWIRDEVESRIEAIPVGKDET